jgi:2-keto-4-pentenoate hydratase
MTPVSPRPLQNQDQNKRKGEPVANSDQMSDNAARIARAFVDARRTGRALPDYPGEMPKLLDDAYEAQDAAIELTGRKVVGWKVGRINPPVDGIDRLAGPIFADQVFEGGDEPIAMPVIVGGFAAAEAEFLLQIGTAPDPAKLHYKVEEATALISAVHVGIEIASSPFPGINLHGPTVTISDFGNNNGLVIGAAIEDWRDAGLVNWAVRLAIDDAPIGAGTAATMLDGPFGAVRFLFESLAARGIALSPGQWISSGAVTGVHEVGIGAQVEAVFDERLTVRCTIEAQS